MAKYRQIGVENPAYYGLTPLPAYLWSSIGKAFDWWLRSKALNFHWQVFNKAKLRAKESIGRDYALSKRDVILWNGWGYLELLVVPR